MEARRTISSFMKKNALLDFLKKGQKEKKNDMWTGAADKVDMVWFGEKKLQKRKERLAHTETLQVFADQSF